VTTTFAAAFLATSMRLVASHPYADGAPPGFSGGFREDSCHACHFHETLNAAPGTLTIAGVPAQFAPGERYTVTITLTREGMKRAGFQLAARFKDSGQQAGSLEPPSGDQERVKVEGQGGVLYAGQKNAGSGIADTGTVRWSVEWIAPAGGGAVVFNVAANAADGNESADGDFIYTASVEAAAAGLIHDPSVEQVDLAFRVVDPPLIVRDHDHRGAVPVKLAEHLAQRIAGF
jgi:hypothetical protein